MRNTWLVIKREYLERVRQRSFIVLTLLLPAIMIGAFVIPAKLSSMKSSKMQRLVVVTSTPQFGEIVRQQVLASSKPEDEKSGADKDDKDKGAEDDDKPGRDYAIEVDANSSEAERTVLRNRVNSGDIDGYLWPVSYTHLDVYKRQVQECRSALHTPTCRHQTMAAGTSPYRAVPCERRVRWGRAPGKSAMNPSA